MVIGQTSKIVTFAMNLRCNIVMDDGSVIYFEYRGKVPI